jgi:hypothetical protein
MRRRLAVAAGCAALAVIVPVAPAQARSVGGCPTGGGAEWAPTLVSDLVGDPADAAGLASLDGNGDGWTCTRLLPNEHQLIFRDNTV